MVAMCTEHTRSRNIEATFRGNHKTIITSVVMINRYNEHTRSRYLEFTFRRNLKATVYPVVLVTTYIWVVLGLEILKPLLEEIINYSFPQ